MNSFGYVPGNYEYCKIIPKPHIMKYLLLSLFSIAFSLSTSAQKTLLYKGKRIELSSHTLYLDAKVNQKTVAQQPHVFNSIRTALEHIQPGTATEPMTIYIAPGVYWIDNPDDLEIRIPKPGESIPYGMELKVSHLRLIGLSNNPQDVVVACNRGQTLGAVGNFTMLHLDGDDIQVENITFGNYCNVDLVYPLNPLYNRIKRSPTIVQAQLIICNSDRVLARNCRFISRLNSCPFAGARRALFDNCYFECTDDALCGTAVYLNSRFTLFSGKPFYATQGTGAVLLNCDLHSLTHDKQYLTKTGSPVSMVDCRWTNDEARLYIGWTPNPTNDLRCYQYHLTLNNKPLFISADQSQITMDMNRRPLLKAYRLTIPSREEKENPKVTQTDTTVPHKSSTVKETEQCTALKDSVIYNVYNLLRGNDNWDPLNQKAFLEKINKTTHTQSIDWGNIPTQLVLSKRKYELISGTDSLLIQANAVYFGTQPHAIHVKANAGSLQKSSSDSIASPGSASLNSRSPLDTIQVCWNVPSEESAAVRLLPDHQGSCLVLGTNHGEKAQKVHVIATTASGLQACCVITVRPPYLKAPEFTLDPKITRNANTLTVNYTLDLQGRADESLITWYRCTDNEGKKAIPVAISRLNHPLKQYHLSAADNGYYMKVTIAPKHLRSHPGPEYTTITQNPIAYFSADLKEDKSSDITIPKSGSQQSTTHPAQSALKTDFLNFPTDYQPLLLPGFWTVDGYKPIDTQEFDWTPNPNSWIYGRGVNGAANATGLLQAARGARLLYTPLQGKYGDMQITLKVDPAKTAGQGFGSATGQYMDIYIKFDTHTLTGYALRIIRTTKYDKAVDFLLMQYKNGIATPLTAPVSSICYRTGCTLQLSIHGDKFTAHAETMTPLNKPEQPELTTSVDLSATITPNTYGGIGIQHIGSTGASATMLRQLSVKWW